jgi:hypothetical protein
MKYILIALVLVSCVDTGPCVESVQVISTTADNAGLVHCWNKLHKTVVKDTTKMGKDISAVVVCECPGPQAEKEK